MRFSKVLGAIALIAAAVLVSGAEARGSTFVPAHDDISCNSICSTQGLESATLRQSDGPLETSVCEANVTGLGRLSGYQQGGSSTCNVVSRGAVTNSTDYSCLCLEAEAQAGLATADSTSCSDACDQSIDGMVGSAVETDSSRKSYTCLPSSEIGHENRFGYTSDLSDGSSICTAAVDGSAMATPNFSCFCSFQEQARSADDAAVAPATARSLPSFSSSDSNDATSVGG